MSLRDELEADAAADRFEKMMAHKKMREEVRNAVHMALKKDGLSKQQISDAIEDVVVRAFNKKMKEIDLHVEEIMRSAVRKELMAIAGGAMNEAAIRKILNDEMAKQAQAFINNAVTIRVIDKEIW